METNKNVLTFICNCCGQRASAPIEQIDREVPSCGKCGSTVRFRSVVHCLSLALFGRSMPLPEFPASRQIEGIGMSDWVGYATALEKKFNYQNTYYHQEPLLDIAQPSAKWTKRFDFIISTEVFEHVPPPVSRAFENTYKLLKPGGTFLLTVPYSKLDTTQEHFPELNNFKIVELDDQHVLVNRRRDGEFEFFPKLVFHGGPGSTLEMRVFCEKDVLAHLKNAGFTDVRVCKEDAVEFGIMHKCDWSLPIIAKRPAVGG